MTSALRTCVDLATLLVCCNLFSRTMQPDVIVVTSAAPSARTAAAAGDLPALARLSAAAPEFMDREARACDFEE